MSCLQLSTYCTLKFCLSLISAQQKEKGAQKGQEGTVATGECLCSDSGKEQADE